MPHSAQLVDLCELTNLAPCLMMILIAGRPLYSSYMGMVMMKDIVIDDDDGDGHMSEN